MNKKQLCEKIGITEAQFDGKETVGGDLDLRGLTSIPDGFNPTVGGYLDLSGLTSIPEGFNPTVGGDLDLRGLTSIPDGFNPTVGWGLYLSGLTSNYTPLNNRLMTWQNGQYISADGIFTKVIRRQHRLFTVKNVNQKDVFYLYSNGAIHAHGDTPEQAKADYRFKKLSEKLKNTPIKKNDIVTVQMYRAITGACDAGVRMFMESNGFEFEDQNRRTVEKTKITVAELLPILEKSNAYGVEKFRKLVID